MGFITLEEALKSFLETGSICGKFQTDTKFVVENFFLNNRSKVDCESIFGAIKEYYAESFEEISKLNGCDLSLGPKDSYLRNFEFHIISVTVTTIGDRIRISVT